MKGNLEMRANFGFQKALVLTCVNGHFYINLYNNTPKNPGRCSIGYDELEELISMKAMILDHLIVQMSEVRL